MIKILMAFIPSIASASILPPNDLYLEDYLERSGGITEQQFNEIIDQAQKIYEPIVKTHGAELKINKLWSNSTVNASAQKIGNTWVVNMYGGLARRPEITEDGFSLVIGHELGHHLAGFPLYTNSKMATEGQSDYYATHVYANLMWGQETEKNKELSQFVDPIAKEKCDQNWRYQKNKELCYRKAMAGLSLAQLLGTLRGEYPDFSTPSTVKVSQTMQGHPPAQCRLDTYFSASLCKVRFDLYKIPFTKDDAYKVSCVQGIHPVGFRPNCWYKP